MVEPRWVDAHCHLQARQFAQDRDAALARAADARCLAVVAGDTLAGSEQACALASASPWCAACVGVHPTMLDAQPWSVEDLSTLAAHPRVVGIGETGLDYVRAADAAARENQRRAFEQHAALAAALGLPVVVHCREAFDDALAVLAEHPACRFLLHSFTGAPAVAERFLALDGCFVSMSGIVTFPRAADVHASARIIPLDRLLVETDAPYLAPVPFRGQRNEPIHVCATVEAIATIRGEDAETLRTTTVQNAVRCFRLDAPSTA